MLLGQTTPASGTGDATVIEDLVAANRIPVAEGVLDAYGQRVSAIRSNPIVTCFPARSHRSGDRRRYHQYDLDRSR
jgi:hypothetical protein